MSSVEKIESDDASNSYFQSKEVTISLEKELDCILLTWHSYVTANNYRKAMNETLQILWDHKLTSLIIDARKFGALSPENQDWTITNFIPKAKSINLNTVCVLVPEDIFGSVSLKMIIKKIIEEKIDYGKIKFNYKFESLESIKKWFKLLRMTKKSNS